MTTVTEPGVYPDMPEDTYHADPVPAGSLSSSGAKKLLPPSTPAHFKHDRDHGQAPKQAFDIGHAVHRLVLGEGAEFHVVDLDSWRTKGAQNEREYARANGLTPLLIAEYDQCRDMANAVLAHPVARHLFDPDHGQPEQSIFWQDEETGVWRRARLDWLPENTVWGRRVIPDLKTTTDANPRHFGKKAADFGYYLQAAWYLHALTAAGIDDNAAFIFVNVEKTAPYLVSVVQLDEEAESLGRHRAREALRIYRDCTEAGIWPGWSTEVELASLPHWFMREVDQ